MPRQVHIEFEGAPYPVMGWLSWVGQTGETGLFFKNECPDGKDKDDFAAANFASLKERDLTHAEWDKLGRNYGAWWKNYISATYRKSRQGK